LIIFAVYLARIRVYEEGDLKALEGKAFTPLVANFMYKRRVAEVMLDLCLIPLAYYMAYRLRFEGELLAANFPYFMQSLPVIIAAQLLALFVVGGYRGTWRHFGMMDAVTFGKGIVLGAVAAQITILYLYRFESYSRAVFVIYAALLMLLLSGSRASFRLLAEFILRRSSIGQRCVIYGTSGASVGTIREAFGTDASLKVVGFIDDDPRHRGMRVAGYSVLGDYTQLLGMIERRDVDCIVLNTPVVSEERLQELERQCGGREIDLLRLHVHLKPLSAEAS
jgi:UDP-GlcNAc:undecaprenyl-phosphate GlcNAc-1-phosphate transferase